MSVTNRLTKQRLSKRKISSGIAYTYAGVIDTVGNRFLGAYIDNKSVAFGGTCINTTDANAQCCSDNGPPYYDPNTCNFYYIQFQNAPSSSFSSSPYAGYYDASSSSLKKGFKSFAVASYAGTQTAASTYYTCATNCATTTEQDIINSVTDLGDSSFAGIKEADGTLWTWGYNNYGQLGNNSVVRTKSPVQLGSNSWKMVSGGYYYFLAIRSDDTLWGWGRNGNQLGDNSTVNRSSPVQISGGGTWQFVAAGDYQAFGIKTDDTLWGWGGNPFGQLGDNSTVNRSSPVQVSGGGSWKYVHTGYGDTFAIKTNGTMYAMGYNTSKELGDGTSTNRSSPVQIGTASADWTSVRTSFTYANSSNSYAVRSNGTAYAWGYNPLGLSAGTYSFPTQIGSATNHAKCSIGTTRYYSYIGGEFCVPFISTDGNLIAYNAYNSTQVTKYSGGGAKQLIVDACTYSSTNNNAFLMKYIE